MAGHSRPKDGVASDAYVLAIRDFTLRIRIGGEGGIRTPDTVARMPHFECGAFNRSATSPEGEKRERRGAVFSGATRGKQEREIRRRLKLPAELAIERVGTAAAQRDGKADQPPQQHVFVTALRPAKAVTPVERENHQHLDRNGRCEETGEQAENERD